MFTPLFEAVLQKIGVGANTALLDIGCGSGVFCEMAAKLGAQVSGLDAAEPLLAIARERVPQGDFRAGEMEELPYANQTFDVVAGFNSFQFAANPMNALKEARRVSRSGTSLVIGVLGKPEDSDSKAYFAALGSLVPPPPPGAPDPFALSFDGALEALVTQAGMSPGKVEDIDCLWEYIDERTLLRGLLSADPAIRASQHAGEAMVRDAILKALAPFKVCLKQFCHTAAQHRVVADALHFVSRAAKSCRWASFWRCKSFHAILALRLSVIGVSVAAAYARPLGTKMTQVNKPKDQNMMESSYIIRPFSEQDVNQIVELWNRCLPYDRITPEKLLQLCLAPSYDSDGIFVAERQGEIIGFLPAIISRDESYSRAGWILSLVIDRDHRHTSVGKALLEAAEVYLKSKDKTIIEVANFREFWFFPHFDSRHSDSITLLEKAGFKSWRELVDIERSLIDFQAPQWVDKAEQCLVNEGVSFDYCYQAYRPTFLAFLRDNFSERWYRHNQSYVEQNGDPKTKILALKSGEVVGFINFIVSDAIGRIRQTGVLPALRGKKIGSILVFKAIAEMQTAEAKHLSILSCPLEFYRAVAGEVVRTRVSLNKVLST